MGRFGITARVVDSDGDAGEIVDKRKGERLVRYDRTDCGVQWVAKGLLRVETVEAVEAWVPKVGDRVRNIGESGYGADFPLGGEGTGCEAADRGAAWAVSDATAGWRGFFFKSEIEPVVAPVASPEKGAYAFKVGDRVRVSSCTSGRVNKVGEVGVISSLPMHKDYCVTLDSGANLMFDPEELSPVPTTWAPVAGKFGKTRDGRKVGPIESGYFYEGRPFCGKVEGSFEVSYLANGREWASEDSSLDLISEWPAEVAVAPATATPEVKVGDRVEYTGTYSDWLKGKVGVVTSAPYQDSIGVLWDGEAIARPGVFAHNLTILAPATATKFKVGDRVTLKDDDDNDLATVATRNSEGVMSLKWDHLQGVGSEWWRDEELMFAPALTPGTAVTITGKGRVTARTGTHTHVVIDGAAPGQNSFAIPTHLLAAE